MKLSNLSFGASSLGSVFHETKEEESIKAVETALEGGINFIDVSPYYGHYKAETVLGKALKRLPRDKFYLSTKVGRYGKDGKNTWDYSAKRATESVLNFCHYCLNDDELLDYLDYFEGKGVGVINASPLSMGLLTLRGVPDWHPAPKPLVKACAEAAKFCQDKGYPIEKLAIQYSVGNPRITSTLFSSANPMNVERNIEWAREAPDAELVNDVKAIIGEQQRVSWANS